MARTLGGIALPDGAGHQGAILWLERHHSHGIAQQTDRTLGGGLVLYQQSLTAGRPITLLAAERTAWLTQAEVAALKALGDAPGAIYTLDWEGQLMTVAFRHHDPPAYSFAPIYPERTDWWTGELRLMTV